MKNPTGIALRLAALLILAFSTSANAAPYASGEYMDRQYSIFNIKMNWYDARKYCESLGGHLATITSSGEQMFINSLNTNNLRLWIGGYRNTGNDWFWITGEPWEYTNWSYGEPNNSSNVVPNEQCASVWPKEWNDLNGYSNEQEGFICEWELPVYEVNDIDLTVSSKTATVSYLAEKDCDLYIAFYDENNRLVSANKTNIKGNHENQDITIPVPEIKNLYCIKAFLWETASSEALSNVKSILINDGDFIYSGNAYYDDTQGMHILTKDYSTWDAGAVWFDTEVLGNFTVELDYYSGSPNRSLGGGDGMAVAFYANKENPPQTAGELGFSACGGYGIELDTWSNSNVGDPSYKHIALIYNDVQTHLSFAELAESKDESWHHLKIIVRDNICTAYVDGAQKLSGAVRETDYSYIGFTAGTGDGVNLHAVKNIVITH